MTRRTIIIAALVGAGLAAVATGTMVVASQVDDEHDTPITGEALQKASAAAIAHTGGGRVTGTEVGDEESYYEVEVTLDDGRQIDVQLDEHFQVVSDAVDDESEQGDD